MGTERLREIQRELSSNYYFITKENIDAYDKWNSIVYNRDKHESVSASKVRADEKTPELRMTRKIMEAIDHVLWSIRSEISILKNEEVKRN